MPEIRITLDDSEIDPDPYYAGYYLQGALAHWRGEERHKNPYTNAPAFGASWKRGWDDFGIKVRIELSPRQRRRDRYNRMVAMEQGKE